MLNRKHLLFAFGAFFALWFLGGFAYRFSIWPFAGIFGQTDDLQNIFSPIGTLFSGLASGGAIYAIFQQAQAFQLQQKAFEIQLFENNFYNMLNLHKDNKSQIIATSYDREGNKTTETGIKAFQALHNKLEGMTSLAYNDNPRFLEYVSKTEQKEILFASQEIENAENKFRLIYEIFSESTNHCLSHYFRNLYHTFKYIDEKIEDSDLRKKYFSIARAQLSPYEYALFYYNGLANEDKEEGHTKSKVKELIEKNALLHNITESLLFDSGNAGEYADSARKPNCPT